MENNTTNFVQTEEDIKDQPEATLTTSTSEVPETKGKTTKFNKPPQKKMSQTDLKLKDLSDKFNQLVQYLADQEQREAHSKIRDTACLLEIMDTVYKDCPKVREDSISKEEGKDFISVLGLYHKKASDKQIVKVIPLEEGWKMTSITPNDPEKPTSFTANYEFKGITLDANYPTTWTVTGQDPYSFTMKLREYLLSLKEEKIIITNDLPSTK